MDFADGADANADHADQVGQQKRDNWKIDELLGQMQLGWLWLWLARARAVKWRERERASEVKAEAKISLARKRAAKRDGETRSKATSFSWLALVVVVMWSSDISNFCCRRRQPAGRPTDREAR